ncbi:ATP-binding cassette domain-containing protein [Ornithinimicrobium sp. INDO-MA30-4]|uniref:ATP-binding cassette domain-containing protein n=1 Tax=Ornithinimicrobium sp. INDO-MA30-4 TaxID=2908651 RepID=UPI002883042E|nr:ATP-binding cassette domain-containing protein [Ornithinimicrobium sp. INDO-MA30-4]
MGVLKQLNQLSARLTVIDLVRFGRFPHCQGHLQAEDHRIVEQAMDYVDLQEFRDRFLDQLSGGQRQRALIAMVLAQDTEYILLDEPLNNLDMRHGVAMMQLLRQAADDLGRTIVVVLHDINFASAWTDYLVGMRDGSVVAQGTPEQIVQREPLREIFGLDMQVVDVAGRKIGMYWHPELIGAERPTQAAAV